MGIMPTATLKNGQTLAYWDRDAVMERLAEAARTLKAMPGTGCFPHNGSAWWPEVIRGFWEVWNVLEGPETRRQYAEERNYVRLPPRAAAIDRMDQSLRWLNWVDDRRQVRVLWALALGIKPGRLRVEMGVSREMIRIWKHRALDQIVCRLNA